MIPLLLVLSGALAAAVATAFATLKGSTLARLLFPNRTVDTVEMTWSFTPGDLAAGPSTLRLVHPNAGTSAVTWTLAPKPAAFVWKPGPGLDALLVEVSTTPDACFVSVSVAPAGRTADVTGEAEFQVAGTDLRNRTVTAHVALHFAGTAPASFTVFLDNQRV